MLSSVLIAASGLQISSILPWLDRDVEIDAVLPQEPDKSYVPNGHTKQQRGWERSYNSLGELIYGLENLRKRRGTGEDEDVDGGPGEADEKESL